MSDNFYKSIGVQNNIILRGQPLLLQNAKMNPVFVDASTDELKISLEKTNKEVDVLKSQVQTLLKELTALKSSAPATKPAVVAPTKPVAKPVVKNGP